MAVLKIITEPDPRYGTVSPRLRQKSAPVAAVNEHVLSLAQDMFDTMADANGVGLAAPQVGILQRLIVIHVPEGYEDEDDEEVVLALVNPEIVRAGGRRCDTEGCLSFPELYGDVERYMNVTVRALDLEGNKIKLKASGVLATVLQHEIDHLDGILYFDRMEDWSTLRYPRRVAEEDDVTAESPADAPSAAQP